MPRPIQWKGTAKTDWNFTYNGPPFDSDQWSDLKAHQPFFARINFQETHRAFHAPKQADPAKIEDSNDQGKELEPLDLVRHKGMTKAQTNPQSGYDLDETTLRPKTLTFPAQKP